MSEHSNIGWTDHTFNPWWGCEKVSPACDHCYAEAWAKRTGHGLTSERDQGPPRRHLPALWGPGSARRLFSDKHWAAPLEWDRAAAASARGRARVFCASMADVFEAKADLGEPRDRLWGLIERTPHLDWMMLTKRPENVTSMVPNRWLHRWPVNVWLGVTAETQEWLEARWAVLRELPMPVKFLSCEPLLGPIRLPLDKRISWVIVGGESGAGARTMEETWARSLLYQCEKQDIPCFMKQLGDGLARSLLPKDARKKDRVGALLDHLPPTMQVRHWP